MLTTPTHSPSINPSADAHADRTTRLATFKYLSTAALALVFTGLIGSLSGCDRANSAPASTTPPAGSAAAASFYSTPFEKKPTVPQMTEVGRAMFLDASLSASGKMSCASCHDPSHAFAPANNLAVQLGGADMKQPGVRAVPSLKYQQDTPYFNEHYQETDGNDSVDQGPAGGRGWDGRAASAHDQALIPLLSQFEMANTDTSSVIEHLKKSPNAQRIREAFGDHIFDNSTYALNALLLSLEVFQQSPKDFYPYDSKYDAFLRHQTKLTVQEMRGLAAFNDENRGNCAACHISYIRQGGFPQFTDRGLIAIGVPRNRKIPANADPKYFDLGLCGPLRTDLSTHDDYCGLFKTPTLRNVATRQVFFHNGVIGNLEDAVRFYAERDVHPEKYYPRGTNGKVKKFDDLPVKYQENINAETPFDRKPGEKPALTSAEIKDIVAFLRTLNDGYVVKPDAASTASK